MFICVCKAVTAQKLKQTIKEGNSSLESVIQSCGAGGDCGSCRFKVHKMINEHVDESAPTEDKAEGF